MSLQAEVEFLAARSERPVYYASSAGRLPDVPADAKPRESVEARALVFYR